MASARRFHTATLLTGLTNTTLNNKVLVVGGNSGGNTSLTSVQIFDGISAWSTGTVLPSAREGHTATIVAGGKLLLAGGRAGPTALATTVLLNPASGTGSWASAGTMTAARQFHSATALPTVLVTDGQVLVGGGSTNGTNSFSSAELWDGTSTWTPAMPLPGAIQGHTATLLLNNTVQVGRTPARHLQARASTTRRRVAHARPRANVHPDSA
jgi:hypothetical protein